MSGDSTDHCDIILDILTRLLQFLQLGSAGLHLCMRKMEDGLRGRGGRSSSRHYLLLVVLLVSLQGLELLLKTGYLLHLCPLACLLLRELLFLVCNLCEEAEGEGGRERGGGGEGERGASGNALNS